MVGFDAIGITTSEMAAAVDFFGRLGVEFPAGAETEGHVEASLGGGLRLMLDTDAVVAGFDPAWDPRTQGSGRVTMAFLCDSPREVDRKAAELRAAGYSIRKEPWDAFWGQRYAVVDGPDGVRVDLFAPR